MDADGSLKDTMCFTGRKPMSGTRKRHLERQGGDPPLSAIGFANILPLHHCIVWKYYWLFFLNLLISEDQLEKMFDILYHNSSFTWLINTI